MKGNQIKDGEITTIDDISAFHEAMMPIARKDTMKKKWNFLITNQWDIDKDWIAVELFGFNLQKDYKAFVIFGFSFIWEK